MSKPDKLSDDAVVCPRCAMRFAISEAPEGGEYTRCAEPKCDRRFWHTPAGQVGVEPRAQLEMFGASGGG